MRIAYASAAAAAALLLPGATQGCGTRPTPATRQWVSEHSDVIVRGHLTYRWIPKGDADGWDLLIAKITARTVKKGNPAKSYKVHQGSFDFYCSGWGWFPDRDEQRRYDGAFYLRRANEDLYVIVRYEP